MEDKKEKPKQRDRIQQILALCYRFKEDKTIEYLLFKRIESKGGFWQPISGGVEPEDNFVMDGCFRELEEEAGISRDSIDSVIIDVHQFTITKHYITGEDIKPLTEHAFGIKLKDDVKISIDNNISIEHEKFDWFNYEEAMKLLKWDDNKMALRKVNEILLGQRKPTIPIL